VLLWFFFVFQDEDGHVYCVTVENFSEYLQTDENEYPAKPVPGNRAFVTAFL
jgi:hypothetical protein